MSHYDEPEEPDMDPADEAEPPIDSTPAGTFTATVSREEIAQLVAAGRLLAQMSNGYRDSGLHETAKKAVARAVRRKIEVEADRLIGEGLAPIVNDLMVNGWDKTDEYGRSSGKVTVRSLIVAYLTNTDRYGDRKTKMEQWVDDIVKEAMKAELAPLIEEAKKRIRTALEGNVTEAIRSALLAGMGLR